MMFDIISKDLKLEGSEYYQTQNKQNISILELSNFLKNHFLYKSLLFIYNQNLSGNNQFSNVYNIFLKKNYPSKKIAYITDTFLEINGVAKTTQKLLALTNQYKFNIDFIVSYDCDIPNQENLINFKPEFSFKLPEYREISINFPNFFELFHYIEKNHFDIIYSPTPGPMGIMAFVISKILNLPFICSYHTDFPEYVYRYTSEPSLRDLVIFLFRVFYNLSDKVLVPSFYYQRKLIEIGIEKEKIEVFKRGVNLKKFHPSYRNKDLWRNYDSNYDNEDVILYTGRIAIEKDLDVFVKVYELMKNNPKVKFVMVGDGPYLKELKEIYKNKIIFTGFLEGKDLSIAYASSDYFLFPSTTETFGNVILEAMASGLIPLVADKGASQENIINHITGFVIENNDPTKYKLILEKLIYNHTLKSRIKKNILNYIVNIEEESLLLEMINKISCKEISNTIKNQIIYAE
jgi:glycosyltransferase involved in cell wall biosynthesis